MFRLSALLLLLFISGCNFADKPQAFLVPEGPVAQNQSHLFMLTVWLSTGIFIVVTILLLYAVFKFRSRDDSDELPAQNPGNPTFELVWTLIPTLIIVLIAIPTVRNEFLLARTPAGSNPLQVEVRGHQFWWEFRYPDLGIVTANELHVPAGRVVKTSLTSEDVIHSFWIPRLAGKIDANPGKETGLWFTAEKPGVYYGQCGEYCGTSHANMQMRVIAESRSDFDNWVTKMKQAAASSTAVLPPGEPGAAPTAARADTTPSRKRGLWERHPLETTPSAAPVNESDPLAAEGRRVFASGACAACHTLADAGAAGKVGPNLNNFGMRSTLGAGILRNTPENLKRWIKNPAAVKPGVLMPTLPLSDDQLDALTAYLESLK